MDRVAAFPSERQPMHPVDQVRHQMRTRLLPQIAELILRADKGVASMTLADLRSDESRAVYIHAALSLFEPLVQAERRRRVHLSDAHVFGNRDTEQQEVTLQARADVGRFGNPAFTSSHYGSVRPGFCWVCKERITPADAFVLELSATLKADVHGACCQDDAKFELMSAFSFRLIEGGRT